KCTKNPTARSSGRSGPQAVSPDVLPLARIALAPRSCPFPVSSTVAVVNTPLARRTDHYTQGVARVSIQVRVMPLFLDAGRRLRNAVRHVEMRLQPLHQLRLGHEADDPLDHLAVLEQDHRRDARNAKVHGRVLVLVDVELDDPQLARLLSGDLLEYWRDHAARP